MSNPEEQVFWDSVDQFIQLANTRCDDLDPSAVAAAMLHASARFSAFVVASASLDRKEFTEEMESSLKYLTNQYRELLRDNLEDYRENYKVYTKADTHE